MTISFGFTLCVCPQCSVLEGPETPLHPRVGYYRADKRERAYMERQVRQAEQSYIASRYYQNPNIIP